MADTTKRHLSDPAISCRLVDRKDVQDEIKQTLATLVEVDQVYGRYRIMLERWMGPPLTRIVSVHNSKFYIGTIGNGW